MLTEPIYRPQQQSTHGSLSLAVHKQAFQSIAKCIAALTVTCRQEGSAVVNQFVNDIKVGIQMSLMIFLMKRFYATVMLEGIIDSRVSMRTQKYWNIPDGKLRIINSNCKQKGISIKKKD